MCEVYQINEIGNSHQSLVLGKINQIHVDDDCAEITAQGRLKIHADKFRPLARLGASEYVDFGKVMTLKRPA